MVIYIIFEIAFQSSQYLVGITCNFVIMKTRAHVCCNVQHYLLNTTKYFTSNTQLLFLPGIHHLHTDIIIQKVHNILLVGNATQDVVIWCERFSSAGVLMVNITNVAIRDLIIKDCEIISNNQYPQ